jgi:xylulokinase
VTHGGVPVAAGAGDQAAGALGVGVVAEGGPASVVLGTSGVVFAALDRYAHDPQARVHAFCHAVPQAWHIMGVMLSAAGSLQWLRETVGGHLRRAARRRGRVGAGGRGPALRALPGRRAHAARRSRGPWRLRRGWACATIAAPWRARCSRAWPSPCATRSTSSRSWAGRPRVGRISGGGARSQLWLEIVASVLEMPLEATVVDEGAAYGAALLGGVAAGVWGDAREAVSQCVKVTRTIEPAGRVDRALRRGARGASAACTPRCVRCSPEHAQR